jgi:2-polyprenyl-3-methyl-5-hydroxy-6-metoxy-1,4-benzoquinol methylase
MILTNRVGHITSALDIGCGNGRFSLTIAEFADSVIAFDLSSTLIEEATEEARVRAIRNIEFRLHDLEQGMPAGPFDAVFCMGVVSTLIDNAAFDALLDQIEKITPAGGFLITKDTLSTEAEDRVVATDAYVTNYRTVLNYESALIGRGFKPVEQARLATLEGMINNLYLWQKL